MLKPFLLLLLLLWKPFFVFTIHLVKENKIKNGIAARLLDSAWSKNMFLLIFKWAILGLFFV